MSGRVILEIVGGAMSGRRLFFDEHDTYLFGRDPACHACLPDDGRVSRHHFLLEVNPPDARILDLGSRNGTFVNDVKYGGRGQDEAAEETAAPLNPEIDLKNGDRIRVGDTVIAVSLEGAGACSECGCPIADGDRVKCTRPDGTFFCFNCGARILTGTKTKEAVRCARCGKDAADEAGVARLGDYVCRCCREEAGIGPRDILVGLLGVAGDEDGTPGIGGYEIEKDPLGVGSFGAVYLGRRRKDDVQVAIKVLLSQVAVDEHSRRIFLREISAMKELRHGNIVSCFGHGSVGSAFYLITKFCEGGSIEGLAKRTGGKLPLSVAAPIMLQALEGLSYIHGKGVVHRDLKPANILLTGSDGSDRVKIADLGLSRSFQKAGYSGMTMMGVARGTPLFMPREQVTDFNNVRPVSDVWSMGATFYNMLTGAFPREFDRGQAAMEVVLGGRIIPVRERDAGIPREMARVIDKSLSTKPDDRYQTAADLRKAFKEALGPCRTG
ncbi:MAG: protein kinase [Elusimicrobia bacterium]|nr:protein kinase [Elusimicrobiota bacterium]